MLRDFTLRTRLRDYFCIHRHHIYGWMERRISASKAESKRRPYLILFQYCSGFLALQGPFLSVLPLTARRQRWHQCAVDVSFNRDHSCRCRRRCMSELRSNAAEVHWRNSTLFRNGGNSSLTVNGCSDVPQISAWLPSICFGCCCWRMRRNVIPIKR